MLDRGRVVGPEVPAWLRACTWKTWSLLEKDSYLAQFDGGSVTAAGIKARGHDPSETWAVIVCNPSQEAAAVSPGILVTGILSTWRLGERPPALVHDYLVALAYASIQVPVQVGDAAPFGDDRAPMITQLPTWLWVDPAQWSPVSATTPAVFGITATVRAVPTSVVFEGGGQVVDCGSNIGPPYDFSLPEQAQHSDCTLTYHHSSSVGNWDLTSTIRWSVSFSCSDGCGTGQLPDFVIRNTRDVRVAELQAVLVPTGSAS